MGSEGLGASVQDLSAYFNVDGGPVALTQLEMFQRVLDILTDLFDQLGLQMNTWKMVLMFCNPCHTPGSISKVAHERRKMGMGPTYI